jgi:hypothetical protein
MATVGERLRAVDEATMYEAPASTKRTVDDAADTIDALVAALEEARDKFEGIRHDMRADDEIMQACRLAVDSIDAALAFARK